MKWYNGYGCPMQTNTSGTRLELARSAPAVPGGAETKLSGSFDQVCHIRDLGAEQLRAMMIAAQTRRSRDSRGKGARVISCARGRKTRETLTLLQESRMWSVQRYPPLLGAIRRNRGAADHVQRPEYPSHRLKWRRREVSGFPLPELSQRQRIYTTVHAAGPLACARARLHGAVVDRLGAVGSAPDRRAAADGSRQGALKESRFTHASTSSGPAKCRGLLGSGGSFPTPDFPSIRHR